jgi:hypothetical protein
MLAPGLGIFVVGVVLIIFALVTGLNLLWILGVIGAVVGLIVMLVSAVRGGSNRL